jgi:hypothetical protein
MPKIGIIKDGQLLNSWTVDSAVAIFTKFGGCCKEILQTARWADGGCGIKRKIDPDWVILRNNAKQRRLVLVNLDNAPADYLEKLSALYGWR